MSGPPCTWCLLYSSTSNSLLPQNFGIQVSRTLGVAALGWFGVRAQLSEDFDPENPDADPSLGCDFTNLPYLLLTAHTLMPMLTIPLTFLLIPNCNMKDGASSGPRMPLKHTVWRLWYSSRRPLVYEDLEPDKIKSNANDSNQSDKAAVSERFL
jgi:hypothetical protein